MKGILRFVEGFILGLIASAIGWPAIRVFTEQAVLQGRDLVLAIWKALVQ